MLPSSLLSVSNRTAKGIPLPCAWIAVRTRFWGSSEGLERERPALGGPQAWGVWLALRTAS